MKLLSRQILRPPAPEGALLSLARLSPDGARLAYVRADGERYGVYMADPATGWNRRLAAYDAPIEGLAWSPDGAHIAYVVGSKLPLAGERRVAWGGGGPGEAGRLQAASFAWSPAKATLFLADVAGKALLRQDAAAGEARKLADLVDRGDADFPPSIAVSEGAKQIAFTSIDPLKDEVSVHVLGRDDSGAAALTLVTKIPGGDVHVRPFWSPRGVTLGLYIAHAEQERSAVIALPKLEGDGIILYSSELLDAAVTPAWTPSGKGIVLFSAGDDGSFGLALLDASSRSEAPRLPEWLRDPESPAEPLLWGELPRGTQLRFTGPGTLVLDGGAAVEIFTFQEPF